MPNFTFKLISTKGSLDLASYLRVNPGEGLDPAASDFKTPSFADNPFADAQTLLSEEIKNKELVWPLLISASSKDALHLLIEQINLKLSEPSLIVEWKDASATNSTYFNVKYGKPEVEYNYRIGEHNYHKITLRIWAEPYGHTATERLVASVYASGPAFIINIPSPLLGDTQALTRLQIQPSYVGTTAYYSLTSDNYEEDTGEFFAFGARASSANSLVIPPASLYLYSADSEYDATADEAVFSMKNFFCRDHDPIQFDWEFNATQYIGQKYRVFLLARNRTVGGIALQAYGPHPAITEPLDDRTLGATAYATNYRGYGVIDFGTLDIPTSYLANPDMYIRFQGQRLYKNDTFHGVHGKAVYGGYCPTSYYLDTATGPGLQIKNLVLIPEPITVVSNAKHTPIALETADGTAGTSIALSNQYDNYGNKWEIATWLNATSQWYKGVPDTTVPTNTCYPWLYPGKPTGAAAAATFGNKLSLEGGVDHFVVEMVGAINLSGDPWLRLQKIIPPISASKFLHLELHNNYYKVGLGNTSPSRALNFTNRGDGRADFRLRWQVTKKESIVDVENIMRDVATDRLPLLQSVEHAYYISGGYGLGAPGDLYMLGYATHLAATSILNTNSAASLSGDLQIYSMNVHEVDHTTWRDATYRIDGIDQTIEGNTLHIEQGLYGDFPKLAASQHQQIAGIVTLLPGAYPAGAKVAVYARERFNFVR